MSDFEAAGVNFAKLFASVDAMDTESFLSFIHADATFRFSSSPPVTGRAGIGAAVGGFFSLIAALEHEISRFVTDGNAVICEGEVTYTRHDGSTISLPFVNVFEVKNKLISLYRIYIDTGPLFAE